MLSATEVRPPQLDEFFSAGEAPLRATEFAELGWAEDTVWANGVTAAAAGSLAAAARLRPTDRDGFAQVVFAHQHLKIRLALAYPYRRVVDAIAGAGHTAISWCGRCIAAANCLCVCRWNYAGAGTE
jgi:hypothetical protein